MRDLRNSSFIVACIIHYIVYIFLLRHVVIEYTVFDTFSIIVKLLLLITIYLFLLFAMTYLSRSMLLTATYILLSIFIYTTYLYRGNPVFDMYIYYPILILTIFSLLYYYHRHSIFEELQEIIDSFSRSMKNIELVNTMEFIGRAYILIGTILYLIGFSGLVNSINYFIKDYVYGVVFTISIATIALIGLFNIKPFTTVTALTIMSLSSWIATPLIPLAFSLYTSVQDREVKCKGIYIGKAMAKLDFGTPRRVNKEFSKYLVSRRKGKIWYWRSYTRPVCIDLYSYPNPHVIIFGSTGMGKSSLAKNIVLQMYKKYSTPFLILDYHGEYIDLTRYFPGDILVVNAMDASINPLELNNRPPRIRSIELADIIQSIFNLGYIQRNFLEDLFIEAYRLKGIFDDNPETWSKNPPTFNDVLKVLDGLYEESMYKGVVERIRPYIRMLSTNVFLGTRIELKELLSTPSIILLNSLPSDQIRALYVDTLLYKLVNAMYHISESKGIAIVIDEAHNLFKRTRSKYLISKLFRESRKYGVSLILITQQPLDVNESLILNSYTRVSFNIKEYKNIDYMAKAFTGYSQQDKVNAIKTVLPLLKKFQAIVNIGDTIYIVDTKPVSSNKIG